MADTDPGRSRCGAISMFYSYSHHDRRLRAELGVHACMLRRDGLIDDWHYQQTGAGKVLDVSIRERLETADVIVPLLSPAFLASDVCYVDEMGIALERLDRGAARVVPIVVRRCDWRRSKLGHLKALPRDGFPVMEWDHHDAAWQDVVDGLRGVVEELRADVSSFTPEMSPDSLSPAAMTAASSR